MQQRIPIILLLAALTAFHALPGAAKATDAWEAHKAEKLLNAKTLLAKKRIEDMLNIQNIIPLVASDESLYASITKRVMIGDTIFFTDNQNKNIYKQKIGEPHVEVIGKRGKGPGEFEQIGDVTKIFNEQIGVFDSIDGNIKVYSKTGAFRFETPAFQNFTGKFIMNGPAFVWDQKDTLWVSAISLYDTPPEEAPWHGKFKVHWNEENKIEDIELIKGFGKRPIDHEKRFGQGWPNHFRMIGSTLWVGSPHFSKLTLYNQAGDLIKEVVPNIKEPLTPEHYEDVDPKDRKQIFFLINYHGIIHDIEPFGNNVMVKVGTFGYVLFDREGNQLSDQGRMRFWHDSFDTSDGQTILFDMDHENTQRIPNQTFPKPQDEEQRFLAVGVLDFNF